MDSITSRVEKPCWPRCMYQVFLSFRGKDTRNSFTSHLYYALKQAGIHTFRDDDEISRAEKVTSELVRAIDQARISIVVFSKNYATSSFCLNELLDILKGMKNKGKKVLPVFYYVQPSQVREQSGSFGDAFAVHEEEFKGEIRMVEKWREALREAADLAGMVLQNQDEANFIQDIVKSVEHLLNRKALRVPSHIIGIEPHADLINSWIHDFSTDANILILHGIGGVGKTTIAKVVYNMNYGDFDGSSFIAEIRKAAVEPRGLVRIQRQLIKDILKGKKEDINNVDEGIVKIAEAICCRRVLIVLDDVELKDHLDAILGIEEGLFRGSKIIVTTRHANLLKAHEKFWMYKVNELDHEKALMLFNFHAFGQEKPHGVYKQFSYKVVNHCGGLPIALEVLGSSLSGKCQDVWRSALRNLTAVDPDKKIERILRISFDSLSHHHDKNAFLDIVCFFIGKDISYTVKVLDGCGYQGRYRIENLTERSLITIDKQNKLMMHQLLQDMGREIIFQESPDDPAKRSRIWHKDAYDALRGECGTDAIKGLSLNFPMLMEDKDTKASSGSVKRRYDDNYFAKSALVSQENISKRCRLRLSSWKTINFLLNPVQTSDEKDLLTAAFSRMSRLKLIKLEYVKISGSFGSFPKHLTWLYWRGFPLESIPDDLYLGNLVALEMCHSNLRQSWKGIRVLENLKILNLSHSHVLVRTPDFSGLPRLEMLKLKDCINLSEVHESVLRLRNLFYLNLKDCRSLKKLPGGFHMLECLDTLILSGCLNLNFHELLKEIGRMETLKVLEADGIPMKQQQPNEDARPKLWSSMLWPWRLPRIIPESSSFSLENLPMSLVQLRLSNCNLSDDAIPNDLTCLPLLEELDLRGNLFHCLPASIMSLKKLQRLDISDCKELRTLPSLPISMTYVNSSNSTSLEIVTNPQNMLTTLQLNSFDVQKLAAVHGLFRLRSVKDVDAEFIENTKLFNLDMGFIGNASIYLHSLLSEVIIKSPPQRLYECGIYSIFIPGSEVPNWYTKVCRGESILSTSVPLVPNFRIQGINLCVMYDCPEGFPRNLYLESYIELSNETKRLKWIYRPTFFGFHNENDMLWLSHWQNIGNQLEGCDEVRVMVDLSSDYRTKQIGIHFLYEEDTTNNDLLESEDAVKPSQDITCVDISAYYSEDGVYDLCNFSLPWHRKNGQLHGLELSIILGAL